MLLENRVSGGLPVGQNFHQAGLYIPVQRNARTKQNALQRYKGLFGCQIIRNYNVLAVHSTF